ncbi:hypothetical protein Goshw_025912, partial [Gossypium schwendimanii]|nr:hypothetical protein [Gossypium schwendimanii]
MVDKPFYSWTSIMHVVKALERSFGWQIGDGMNERFGLNRWGFEGLDGNYLRASFNGNRDGLNGSPDRIVWFHNKSGCYSSKLGYSWLIFNKLEDVTHLLDLKAYENLIMVLWNIWNSCNNAMFQVEKLPCAFVKINVDAAINDNSVGLRVIARDYNGFVLGGCVMYRETWINVEWAKVESNCASLVNHFKNHRDDISIFDYRLKDL